MVILLSPAKKLDFSETTCTQESKPFFTKKTQEVLQVMQQKSAMEIADLMHLSKDLADLNFERYQKFKKNPEKQAVLAFDGEVYNGLQAKTWNEEMLLKAQEKIIILSGLYGFLKPLDKIKPYRLEMGTKLAIQNHKNLYEFWKPTVTKALNKELEKDELFVNLASTEYFSAIDVKALHVPVITPEFKDYKDGKLKIISFFAKKARGMMVRYIIDTNAETIDDLKGFNYDGYQFDANLSKGNHLVFTR